MCRVLVEIFLEAMIKPPTACGGSLLYILFSCADLVRSPTARAASHIRSETNTISIPGSETWDCEKSVVSCSIAKLAHIRAPIVDAQGLSVSTAGDSTRGKVLPGVQQATSMFGGRVGW
jgi:hypothetical protein